jgi:uncharacterized protein (TIGR02757 family)
MEQIRDYLEEKYLQYNTPAFIENDPVAVPHLFSAKADIEISALLTAVLAWGRREMITKAGIELMRRMDNSPAEFVASAGDSELNRLRGFVYRTFNDFDAQVFVLAVRHLIREYGSLEQAFFYPFPFGDGSQAFFISRFKERFFRIAHPERSRKHLPDPLKNSAAKRINMFLRWMVRNDGRGVDFGIWKSVKPAQLICPLDLHSGRVARRLGLLSRKQDDWKAATELTGNLKMLDSSDPVKYDFALFGIGWYEKF